MLVLTFPSSKRRTRTWTFATQVTLEFIIKYRSFFYINLYQFSYLLTCFTCMALKIIFNFSLLQLKTNFFNWLISKSTFNKIVVYPYYNWTFLTSKYWGRGILKHPFTYVLQKKCSYEFCKIHKKTPVLEFLFKMRLQHRCFPVNIATFLRTAFFIEQLFSGGCI